MAREPEPLERVRVLVCEPCWVNCFDTEGFEKLGRGEVDKFRYSITGENFQAGIGSGCTWCSMVAQVFSQLPLTGDTFEILLRARPDYVITPLGSNFYEVHTRIDKPGRMSYFAVLEFFTEHDNFAAQQVTARDVDRDVTPSKTSSRILRWLKECDRHPCCPQQIDSLLPTRLIDIATSKVCHTNGASGKFAALSYCWGMGSQTQLRMDNMEMLTRHLDVNDLPQTIKDAILVTRSLSIPYLWVDALCIIQDHVEDKSRQIGSMAQIYSNAYITILASNASDAAHGFLADRDIPDAPSARIPFRVAPDRFGSITARKYPSNRFDAVFSDDPLSRRAWALQEKMMANRILAYNQHTLEWRCASGMMNLNNSLNMNLWYDPVPKLISQLSTDPEEALLEWTRIVKDYSRRNMSLQSDMFPAIAALAERFAEVLGHYYAGLWQYDFIKQLFWRPSNTKQENRVGNLYRAPSWSWASVDGILPWRDYEEEDCCNLASAVVLPKNAQVPYGEVVHASIKICGKVAITIVTGESLPTCTLVHYESEVAESPLQRFYKTYFYQDTKSSGPSWGLKSDAEIFWDDYKRYRFASSVVLLLPLRRGWYGVDNDRVQMCQGLALIPAGPGIVRRIGTFVSLPCHEIEDLVEQEITIV